MIILYIVAIVVLFVMGLVAKINAKTPEETKKGNKLMIISALMFVIPLLIIGTVCGLMIAAN